MSWAQNELTAVRVPDDHQPPRLPAPQRAARLGAIWGRYGAVSVDLIMPGPGTMVPVLGTMALTRTPRAYAQAPLGLAAGFKPAPRPPPQKMASLSVGGTVGSTSGSA